MPDVRRPTDRQSCDRDGENDGRAVAKILKLFAAEFKIAALKIGVVDKAVLSTKDVEALAELPSREVLLSQLLGLLLAPATRLVRVLNEPASAFARLLKAKGEQGEASPPAAAAAPETPAPAPGGEETPKADAPEAKEEAPVVETRQEAPVAETKEEVPAPEQAPAAAAETPATESTTGETTTENPA